MAVGFNSALNAYQQALDRNRTTPPAGNLDQAGGSGHDVVSNFTAALQEVSAAAVEDLRAGEAATLRAASGQADVNEVVLAISKAELALQTMTTVRDRALQAYQEIMRMPI